MLIYKVLTATEWQVLNSEGETSGAPVDRADGYIHFSTADQLGETLAKHFTGIADLVLTACDSDEMQADLRWEPSRGGALFPHLYRHLRRGDVAWHAPLPLEHGRHVLPDGVK